MFELTPGERVVYGRLNSPEKIQRFLDEKIAYNKEPGGPTCYGPRLVLRNRVAHCMEGAMFGAAALRMIGFEPLLLDLEAVRDDDHVLAIFRVRGAWGAIAKSNYSGLRYREPVYRNVRELAMSYFDHYYNLKGEKTMRTYSRPVNLRRFDGLSWMSSDEHLWAIPQYLFSISHRPVLTREMERNLSRMDKRTFGAGRYGAL